MSILNCVLLLFSLYAIYTEAVTLKPRYDVRQASSLFENFARDHSKRYEDSDDKLKHYEAFVQTLLWINYLNAIQDSAVFDINDLSDKTVDEAIVMFEKGFTTIATGTEQVTALRLWNNACEAANGHMCIGISLDNSRP